MIDRARFRRDTAAHVQFGDLHTDFILPICMPDLELMVGDALAVLMVTTVEGQRVGVPIGVNALTNLQGVITEALRRLQLRNDGEVSPPTWPVSQTSRLSKHSPRRPSALQARQSRKQDRE